MMERRSLPDDFPTNGDASALPLARRPDFALGDTTVHPSIRTVTGPAGTAVAEPRVMQVLLALADAQGSVLTRADLLESCWNGQIVGDDAIHRAIAAARRIARDTGASFAIETIPKIGYRLIAVEEANASPLSRIISDATPPPRLTRRTVLIGSGIALGSGSAGLWAWRRHRTQAQVDAAIEHGKGALLIGTPEGAAQSVAAFRQAVALAPDNAAAWGWLSAALRRHIEDGSSETGTAITQECDRAAKTALAIDPHDPNARASLALLRSQFDGGAVTEQRMRDVLETAPDNVPTLEFMTFFLQGVGHCRDSRNLNDRLVALAPLSPNCQHKRALKHWIFGEVAQADQVIDHARRIWPEHPFVWNSRLIIYAFTDRPKAALAMIDDARTRPRDMRPPAVTTWRTLLTALDTRTPGDVAAAASSGVAAATRAPYLAASAIMALSALGQLDSAFSIANGFLLGRGPLVPDRSRDGGRQALHGDPGWRKTQWLFTPATAPLRQDPRIRTLTEQIGLADYWAARGIGPDAFVRGVI